MEQFDINAEQITITFMCHCGEPLTITINGLPSANMYAENVSDSQNSEEHSIVCPQCGRCYTITVYVDMNEGNVEVKDDDDDDVDFDVEEGFADSNMEEE